MAIGRGVPPGFWKHAGANCSPGNPAPERNPGLGAILKKFCMKTTLKTKINLIRKTLNFVSTVHIHNEPICRPSQTC
jgi:hypothetical protein